MLGKLERRGIISLRRDPGDRRSVLVGATEAGMALRETAVKIPHKIGSCIPLESSEAQALYHLLYKLLGEIPQRKPNRKKTETESDAYHFPLSE